MSYRFEKDGRIVISGWENGISESPYLGHGQMVNVDIYSRPGAVRIQLKADNKLTGIAGLVKWFAQNPLNGDIYALDDTGVVRVSTDSGDTWNTVAGNTTTGASGNGLAVWVSPNDPTKAFVFVARNANLDVYDIAGTTWTNGWQTLQSTGQEHPMSVGLDNILYIGNRRFVASFEEVLGSTFVPGTAATYKWNPQALDVPAYYDITSLTNFGQNLLSGAEGDDEGTDCQLFPWDRTSDSFNIPVQVYDNRINQLYTKNNIVYINSGKKALMRVFNGSAVKPLHEFFNIDNLSSLRLYPGAITSLDEEILFGIGASTARSPMGVYSSRDGVYVVRNLISTGRDGSTGRLEIGAIYPIGSDQYIVSWFDDVANTRGIDKIGDSGEYYGSYSAYIDTDIIPVGNFIKKPNISQVEFKLGKPLVDGQGIRIAYRKNLSDSFTTIGTFDFATIGSRLSYNYPASISNPEWVQLRVSLTTGSPNADETPELVEVSLIP